MMLEEALEHHGVLSERLDAGEFEGQTVEADEGIKLDWWNHCWFLFTHNRAGERLCLDFDPAPGGQLGQVIGFWHADTDRQVVTVSFESWLASIADLEHGVLVFNVVYGGSFGVEHLR
jgi:cell wall assembly regulator SMI1